MLIINLAVTRSSRLVRTGGTHTHIRAPGWRSQAPTGFPLRHEVAHAFNGIHTTITLGSIAHSTRVEGGGDLNVSLYPLSEASGGSGEK